MLRELRVNDLAIIEHVSVTFGPGFNVITGDTGAGKSILLDAILLALGRRADTDQVRGGAEEAVVEAVFSDLSEAAAAALARLDCMPTNEQRVTVRRIVSANGRSRAYVNDTPVSVATLRDVAPLLLRIYGQDDDQALRRVETHVDLIDAAGGLGSAVAEMRRRHARLSEARQALEHWQSERGRADERVELLRHQQSELERAAIAVGEDEMLETERAKLAHAERLQGLVGGVEAIVYSGEGAAVDALGRALVDIRTAEGLDETLVPIRFLLESALAEIEEAGASLGRYLGSAGPDPERLQVVEDRLAELARLKRKYGGTLEDLQRSRDEIGADLDALESGEERTSALEAECEASEKEARAWAKRLAVERRRVAHEIERLLTRELQALALDGARFEVRFGDVEPAAIGPTGRDEIEFYLAANVGEELRPLVKVASGGERSRVMLALKAVSPTDDQEATLVFDEVDSGVGGAVGEVIGRKLQQLGERRQVLAVTHLPVVAAFGDCHIAIGKRLVGGRTVSTAEVLRASDRVAELARMLAGAKITPEAREHAQQLLQERGGGRHRG
jgi:DNA repair protein RecN (Recombination protein N)